VRGRKIRIHNNNNSGSDGAERKSQLRGGPSPVLRRKFRGEQNIIYEEETVMNQRPLRALSLSLFRTFTHQHTHLYNMVYENVCAQRVAMGCGRRVIECRKTNGFKWLFYKPIYIYIVCVLYFIIYPRKSRNANKLLPPINLMTFARKKVILFYHYYFFLNIYISVLWDFKHRYYVLRMHSKRLLLLLLLLNRLRRRRTYKCIAWSDSVCAKRDTRTYFNTYIMTSVCVCFCRVSKKRCGRAC